MPLFVEVNMNKSICPNPKCPVVEIPGGVSSCPKCGAKAKPADAKVNK
jgi:uncharacterized protein (UPF0212 family)